MAPSAFGRQRARDFLITTGLKSNRFLRVADPEAPKGWRWQSVQDYAAGLSAADYQQVTWPSQGEAPRQVWVHVVSTRVRKLYRCQVIVVRESLDAPRTETRYFASSDVAADVTTLVGHLAALAGGGAVRGRQRVAGLGPVSGDECGEPAALLDLGMGGVLLSR
jgi:hypothetical protein